MWTLFFLIFIISVSASAIFIKNNKKATKAWIAACIMSAVPVSVGIADISGLANTGAFKGAFAFMGGLALTELIISLISRKFPNLLLNFTAKTLLIASVLELTIFQYPSYRIMCGDYPEINLSLSDAILENCEINENGYIDIDGKNEARMSYVLAPTQIGTIYADVEYKSDETNSLNFFADVCDRTSENFRTKLLDSTLVNGADNTQYATLTASGGIDCICFRISGKTEEDTCTIKSFTLNKAIPFDIILMRIMIITAVAVFMKAMLFTESFRLSFRESRYVCSIMAVTLTALTIYFITEIVAMNIPKGEFMQQFRQKEGDQITQELVEAFDAHSVSLLKEPEKELLELENPYDWSVRYYDDTPYEWDHLLYNGKYYSYYGVAPLLLFYPYYKITGFFFPTNIAVMLFSCIGIIFLTLTYNSIIKKWFADIPANIYVGGLVILLSSCGIGYSAGRTKFYEIAISSGFMFILAGTYFLMESGIDGKGRTSLVKTTLSSFFIGLSVLSRPTMAVYAMCSVIWYIHGLKVFKDKNRIKYIICAVLPMGAAAIFQMWYNYARFGSVFEFGIKYSLTINDFTHTQFHLHQMLIGLYNYILAPPAFIPDYPYITKNFSMLGINGYYFKDLGNTSGIFFLAPTVFGVLLARKVLEKADKKKKFLSIAMIGIPCFIAPLIIICSVWESGYALRYTADFSWEAATGAMIILLTYFTAEKNETIKKFFTTSLSAAAVWAVFVNFIQIYNFTFGTDNAPHYAEKLRRLMEIWH